MIKKILRSIVAAALLIPSVAFGGSGWVLNPSGGGGGGITNPIPDDTQLVFGTTAPFGLVADTSGAQPVSKLATANGDIFVITKEANVGLDPIPFVLSFTAPTLFIAGENGLSNEGLIMGSGTSPFGDPHTFVIQTFGGDLVDGTPENANGTNLFLQSSDGGTLGGTPGGVRITAGTAQFGNQDGGSIFLEPGHASGSGNVGLVSIDSNGSQAAALLFQGGSPPPLSPSGSTAIYADPITGLYQSVNGGAYTPIGGGGGGDLVSATLATASGATANTTTNSSGFTFNIPISGADSFNHDFRWAVAGTTLADFLGTANGVGGLASTSIQLGGTVPTTFSLQSGDQTTPAADNFDFSYVGGKGGHNNPGFDGGRGSQVNITSGPGGDGPDNAHAPGSAGQIFINGGQGGLGNPVFVGGTGGTINVQSGAGGMDGGSGVGNYGNVQFTANLANITLIGANGTIINTVSENNSNAWQVRDVTTESYIQADTIVGQKSLNLGKFTQVGSVAPPLMPLVVDLDTGSGPDGGIYARGSSTITSYAGFEPHPNPVGNALAYSGSADKAFWYPRMAAFRAGMADGPYWDDVNIGFGSVAFGNDTTASGLDSTAIGFATTASGKFSLASGQISAATGDNSTVLSSLFSTASGNYSFAAGSGVTASGPYSVAMGTGNVAAGDSSVALGVGMTVNGNNSFGINLAVGSPQTLTQTNSMAIMGGNVGIGTPTPASVLDVAGNVTSTFGTSVLDNVTYSVLDPGSDSTAIYAGIQNTVEQATWTHDSNGQLIGMYDQLVLQPAIGHTVGFTDGYASVISLLSTGTANEVNGYVSDVTNPGAGTVNFIQNFYAKNADAGGGSIGQQTGLYMENMTSAGANYGIVIDGATDQSIWVKSGHSQFDGAVAVDHTGSGAAVDVTETITPVINSTNYAAAFNMVVNNPAANNGSSFVGFLSSVGTGSTLTHNMTGTFYGMQNEVAPNIGVGNTLTKIIGNETVVQNVGAGTITNAFGTESSVANGTGTVTNGTDYHVRNPSNSGTYINHTAIEIDNLTSATNNYGVVIDGASTRSLWVKSGSSLFDGRVTIDPVLTTGQTSEFISVTSPATLGAFEFVYGEQIRLSGSDTANANSFVIGNSVDLNSFGSGTSQYAVANYAFGSYAGTGVAVGYSAGFPGVEINHTGTSGSIVGYITSISSSDGASATGVYSNAIMSGTADVTAAVLDARHTGTAGNISSANMDVDVEPGATPADVSGIHMTINVSGTPSGQVIGWDVSNGGLSAVDTLINFQGTASLNQIINVTPTIHGTGIGFTTDGGDGVVAHATGANHSAFIGSATTTSGRAGDFTNNDASAQTIFVTHTGAGSTGIRFIGNQAGAAKAIDGYDAGNTTELWKILSTGNTQMSFGDNVTTAYGFFSKDNYGLFYDSINDLIGMSANGTVAQDWGPGTSHMGVKLGLIDDGLFFNDATGTTIKRDAGTGNVNLTGTFDVSVAEGIGTTAPNAVSVLDMVSTTKGLLPPRMTTAQRTAITPVEGLIVYDLTIHGLFVYDGTTWVQL